MKYQKVLTILLTVSLLFAGLSLLATRTSATPVQDTAEILAQIAKGATEAQNQLLVSDETVAFDNKPGAESYRDFVRDRFAALRAKRETLSEHQLNYTGFQTELTVTSVRIRRSRATVWATERTLFDIESPGAPLNTGYELDHRFDFIFEESEWKLVSDRVFDETIAEEPEPGFIPVDTLPTRVDEPPKGGQLMEESDYQIAASTLERSKIVSYATKYWSSYNPAYRTFPNDCTNFGSQSMAAGGWTMVHGWFQSDSAWWYLSKPLPLSPGQSYTWGGAHNFYWFTKNRPRGSIAQQMNQLQTGDILQADWDGPSGHKPDGHMDHTMVVTGKSQSGEIFLTYHSNNRLNRAFFSDLLKAEPKAKWYGWRMSSSFS